MSEATKIRLRERKSQPRKSWFRPAKTEKGKWLRFYCCLAAVAVVLFIAFFGKYFAPYDPLATDYAAKLSAPGGSHLFGTDNVGRDVLSRILYGAGNSFILTFIMIAIVSVLGTVIGIVSGFFGGLLDTVIMRLTDILLAFPDTVFAIAIVGMMGPGLLNTVIGGRSTQEWPEDWLPSFVPKITLPKQGSAVSEQQGFCSDMYCRILFPK